MDALYCSMEAQKASTDGIDFNHGEVSKADNPDLRVTVKALQKADNDTDGQKFAEVRQAIMNAVEHSSRHHAVSVDVDCDLLREAHDIAIDNASIDMIAQPFKNNKATI